MSEVLNQQELVFVVHGLSANPLVMWPMARRLRQAGYDVINWGYRSTTRSCLFHGEQLAKRVKETTLQKPASRVHFVGHSMGCIVIRSALAVDPPTELGRVVMLTPPNHGSHVATKMGPMVRWLCPTLNELSEKSDSFVNRLRAPQGYEFGIVAAQFDLVIDQARTHLAGEKDFMVIASNHGFLPWRKITAKKTVSFLRTGFFE